MSTNQESQQIEIILKQEPSLLFLSLLLKAANPFWGNNFSPLSKMTNDYFRLMPLNPSFFKALSELEKSNLTEESLYYLALTYNHYERSEYIFSQLTSLTDMSVESLRHYQQIIFKLLAGFRLIFETSPLKQLFVNFKNQDAQERLENLDQVRQEFIELLDYFKFELDFDSLLFTPTDPIFSEYMGRHLKVSPERLICITTNSSTKAQIYEVLRYFMQPVIKEIIKKTNVQQQNFIFNSTSGKSRQYYGHNTELLLLSDLITTYYNFRRVKRPFTTLENYIERIGNLTEQDFFKSLESNPRFLARCKYFNTMSLNAFQANVRNYYDFYEKNKLQKLLFILFDQYEQQSELSFNEFLEQNISKIFLI